MARKKAPEITFQDHIAAYLVREHRYGVLEQPEITDTEHAIAEDHLWAFFKATQKEALDKLTADYGTDARDEVFKALRAETHAPVDTAAARTQSAGTGVPAVLPQAQVQ